jgi:hypothetical protein
MAVLLWLFICVLVLGGCPESGDGKSAEVPAVELVSAELRNDSGQLRYLRGGEEVWGGRIDGALPYRIVAQGPPAVLTVVGPGLELASWAVGKEAVEYPAMIPLVIDPPLVALGGLMDSEASLGRVSLLNADGSEMWFTPSGELLTPVIGELSADVAYIAGAERSTALYPFGATPVLYAVNLMQGTELWSAELEPLYDAADVRLWAVSGGFGLLHLQYSYEMFEFVRINLQTGELGPRHRLSGAPARRLVYPGPGDEAVSVRLADSVFELGVLLDDGQPQLWQFDLTTGAVEKKKAKGFNTGPREENPLPVGGQQASGPGNQPFPQQLLPEQGFDSWVIQPLVNEQGQVLVISGSGAQWVP